MRLARRFAHGEAIFLPAGLRGFSIGSSTTGQRAFSRIWAGLVKRFGPSATLQSNLSYLLKREAQMQYPTYQAAGWPIGSGMVESAHKRVLQARLKGAGMQWTVANVNAMLALRVSIDNDRWDQQWQQRQDLHLTQQHQRALDRQSRQQRSAEETLKPFLIRFLVMQAVPHIVRCRPLWRPPPAPPPRRSPFNPWRGDPSKAFSLQAKK